MVKTVLNLIALLFSPCFLFSQELKLSVPQNDSAYYALQKAINYAIGNGYHTVYIAGGPYHLKHGLVMVDSAGGFVNGIHLRGDGGGYNPVTFYVDDSAGFGVDFIRCKDYGCEGITLSGVNVAPSNYTVPQVLSSDASVNFITPGVSDIIYAPHAGFVVDGLAYPGMDNLRSKITGGGGSTDGKFVRCRASNFVVDYALSPGGFLQNGEIITLQDCWGDYCKAAISIGQSQQRTILVNNFHCWGWTKTLFDMVNYSNGSGCPPTVTGLNAAGCIRYLCEFATWVNNGLTIRDSHIESLWSLGGCKDPTNGDLSLEDSWVALVGSLPASYYGKPITQPRTTFQGGRLRVVGGHLWQYGTYTALPIAVTAGVVLLKDTYLDYPIIDNYSSAQINYSNSQSPLFGIPPSVTITPFQGTFTVVTNDVANLTTGIIPASVDYQQISIGDILLYRMTDEYGLNYLTPAGRVTKKTNGIVFLVGRAIAPGAYGGQIFRMNPSMTRALIKTRALTKTPLMKK